MSTISFSERGGQLIPFEDGRALCAEDFRAEAASWVTHQDFAAPIAVILGLGAGHHVRAWLEKNPDAHVAIIETRPALVRPFEAANPDLEGRYDILMIDSMDGLLGHEILHFVAETLPPVLCFRPSFGAQTEIFEAFFATLTGRNGLGLKFFLEKFGFDSDALETSGDGRLFTIKDLGVVIDSTIEGHPAASAVRVLRELVV